jgi:multicomponent Na+:H+ antiporter subunit A
MALTAVVLVAYGAALVAPAVHARLPRASGWLLALVPLGVALALVPGCGADVRSAHTWVDALGVRLSFHLDGLALLLGLLVCGVGALVLVYAGGYLAGDPRLGRFQAILLAFFGSMLGLVLADNVYALFVFWELTSLTSYLLIGFDHERPVARAAALQALLVTGGGGLALLAGLVLLAHAGGSSELSALLAAGDAVRAHRLYPAILALVLLGAFTKSAHVPFHFWLPAAMEAPTPVSAYLHSATMVKAGVYLLARLAPVLGGTEAWRVALAAVGGATMLTGIALALAETDLKRVLAYSTVSALGLLTLLLGLGTEAAVTAAMAFLLGHALYKGALFFVAGVVDHGTGSRDGERLRGLRHAMPVTAAAGVAAAVSMAALPPAFGYVGKESVYAALLDTPVLLAATVAASIGFVAVAGLAGVLPFVGTRRATPRRPHEGGPDLLLGPIVLAAAGVVLGLFPALAADAVVGPATSAVLGRRVHVELSLWHGAGPLAALAALTIAGGVAVAVGRRRLRDAAAPLAPLAARGPEAWYATAIAGLNAGACTVTGWLQSGHLRRYLLVTMATLLALAARPLIAAAALPRWSAVAPHELVIAALILLGALTAVRARSRLVAVVALGVVGFGVALVYLLFGAPDLAVTQLIVETLLVVLFVLVLGRLPPFRLRSSASTRVRDAAVSLGVGAAVTTLVLAATAAAPPRPLTAYFARESVPGGHGRNVVNVVLVDFRALDTLGEITVLAAAGVGVYGLLRLRPGRR